MFLFKTKQCAFSRFKAIFFGFSCFLSFNSIAGTMGEASSKSEYKNFEISLEGGINWLNKQNTDLVISPFETDSVRVNHVDNHDAWKVGVGYFFFDTLLSQRAFLNHFLIEANLYQISGTINGDVWQFQLPVFNNYSYEAPFTSTRLMLDIKPNLFSYKYLDSYFILGLGYTWNKLAYTETITGTEVPAGSNLILKNHRSTKLAENLGLGFRLPLSSELSLLGEYVYSFIGRASPSYTQVNNVSLQERPSFSFQTQTVLVGLSLNL